MKAARGLNVDDGTASADKPLAEVLAEAKKAKQDAFDAQWRQMKTGVCIQERGAALASVALPAMPRRARADVHTPWLTPANTPTHTTQARIARWSLMSSTSSTTWRRARRQRQRVSRRQTRQSWLNFGRRWRQRQRPRQQQQLLLAMQQQRRRRAMMPSQTAQQQQQQQGQAPAAAGQQQQLACLLRAATRQAAAEWVAPAAARRWCRP
jgi:hypothetical protein